MYITYSFARRSRRRPFDSVRFVEIRLIKIDKMNERTNELEETSRTGHDTIMKLNQLCQKGSEKKEAQTGQMANAS